MKRVAAVLAFLLSLPLSAAPALTGGPWVLWSRDTHFKDHQPPRLWRTEKWVVRAGPFDSRHECDRRLDDTLNSGATSLGDGYRVTAQLEAALVARHLDGAGLRRRFMCLPVAVAPPR
jgi:hypothetical protein